MPKHLREEERGQLLDRLNRALPVTRLTLWIFIQVWVFLHPHDH